jgi:hypothetical protein
LWRGTAPRGTFHRDKAGNQHGFALYEQADGMRLLVSWGVLDPADPFTGSRHEIGLFWPSEGPKTIVAVMREYLRENGGGRDVS